MVKNKRDDTTEEKIFAAARRVFVAQGMAGARMQDIANEAGMNKALLHYYFRDKEQLFEMVFSKEAAKFFPKINLIFESDIPLFEKIEQFVNQYIDEILENPYLPLFVLNEINRNSDWFLKNIISGNNQPKPEAFLKQIEREVKKKTIRRIHPMHLMLNIISMTIFPFIAKPMVKGKFGLTDAQFKAVMEERRKEVPKFIIDAIKL